MINRPIEEPTPCAVCGCARFRIDEVFDGALLVLSECARCGHRWTARFAQESAPAPPWMTNREPESRPL